MKVESRPDHGGREQGLGVCPRRIAGGAHRVGRRQRRQRASGLDIAAEFASERKQFGRPIGTNQAIAHMLADMQTEVEAARR